MIRHLLRLTWNRKGSNALITLEILACFLVLLAVTTVSVHLATNWQRPLGFDWVDRWTVNIEMPEQRPSMDEFGPVIGMVRREAAAMAEVESASLAIFPPFINSQWIQDYEMDNISVQSTLLFVDDMFADVMNLDLVAGRWFVEADAALHWRSVVINQQLAAERFGSDSAVGRVIAVDDDGLETRVVGVVSDFRQGGELWSPRPYVFERLRFDEADRPVPEALLLRLRPGTQASFEVELSERLSRVAPNLTFNPRPLRLLRREALKEALIPVLVLALVGGFLILMVGMGLTGVLWQTVTRRSQEIGIRRALGATGVAVARQLLSETLVLTTVAILVAIAVVIQLPLSEVFNDLEVPLLAASMAIAAAVMYLLVAACVLYPGWLVIRIQPAEALHSD